MHSSAGLAGQRLYEQRRISEALDCFRQALAFGEDPELHAFQRWACWMLLGRFECAWREADRSAPPWKGDIQNPGHLLIKCLRGLGDAIQFLRYVPLLRRRCGRITVQAPEGLLAMVGCIPGIDKAISREEPTDGLGHDCEIECSDLPYAVRSTIGSIPDPIPVRGVGERPECVGAIREAGEGSLKTGIVWNAGAWNSARSIPLDIFLSAVSSSALTLISLQRDCGYTPTSVDVPACIINAETGGANLLATAAVVAELDLVITVDTMVAHLAGSMSKPVWTILPYAGDWRWMLGQTTPWYPSMRLFRQPWPGDWEGVLREVKTELRSVVSVRISEPSVRKNPHILQPPSADSCD